MISVFDGTLIREGPNQWRWKDGAPEPRVRDLSPDEWNFRCTTFANGTFVEVPIGHAREYNALTWVLERAQSGQYRSGRSGDRTGPMTLEDGRFHRLHVAQGVLSPGPIPSVILVPIEDWDAWVRDNPAGAEWDLEYEQDILIRARALGWKPRN